MTFDACFRYQLFEFMTAEALRNECCMEIEREIYASFFFVNEHQCVLYVCFVKNSCVHMKSIGLIGIWVL